MAEKGSTPAKKNVDFIREIITADLSSGKHQQVTTRFPPEPNGYLHIGHAKSICLNFGIAEELENAVCNLRFDDTNPAKEDQEYVDSIKADVEWLGFTWDGEPKFASDYFPFMHDCAIHLIKEGLAYVDEESLIEMRNHRGSVNKPGTPSRYRERPVEENLARFADMKDGKIENGGAVLRAKIDLTSSNMNMRDPVLYRVLQASHHRTGSTWSMYPMYDFAHSIEDALEHITHSLCTLEFENHRPLYDWVVDNCPVPSKPRQIEFARLNLTYTIMSKRKLLQLVEEGLVTGWDDPRMPTVSGMRRRGYPAVAIRKFCKRIGITKQNATTDVALLEYEIRDHLNTVCPRFMAVLDPLKVVLTNWPEGHTETMSLPVNPEDKAAGNREVELGRELFIEREDFSLDPPKKYFRLTPNQAVRLRGGYIIVYKNHLENADGEVTEVHCEFLPGTVGNDAPEGVKCRTAVHWVDGDTAKPATVNLYDRLFTEENPDGHKDGFVACLNADSHQTLASALVEPAAAQMAAGENCQFERVGYFFTDPQTHSGDSVVFNRTVALRDSWGGKRR